MSLTILHTADWQLGKPYQRVTDDTKRALLQHERLACLRRISEAARESGAACVLVAGDLFDSPTPVRATVAAACEAIGSMNIPVFAIPGNHDHGGPGSLWEQPFFLQEREQRAPNLRVLLTPEPVVLDQAVLFPAPLLRRHHAADPTAWIRTALESGAFPQDRPRLVLAHGSVHGFESAGDEEDEESPGLNRIDLSRLPESEIDYIALGDWHGTKEISPKAWYAGTPEIDRFPKGADNEPGHVLVVRVSRGQPPRIEKKSTGRFRWNEFAYHFSEDAGFDTFQAALDTHIGAWGQDSLLKLSLAGSLGIETSRRLAERLASLDALLLRVKLDDRVTLAPTDEEMHTLADRPTDPLIAAVAAELISMSQGPKQEIARLALRELHAALR